MTQRIYIPVATDSGGDYTITIPRVRGYFVGIKFADTDLDAGTTLSVVGVTTGVTLISGTLGSTSFDRQVRVPVHGTDLVAVTYVDGGSNTVPVYDALFVDDELTVTVASGGNTTTGEVWLQFA